MCHNCRKALRDLEIKHAALLVETINHNKNCEPGYEFNFTAAFVSADNEVTLVNCLSLEALATIEKEFGVKNVPH